VLELGRAQALASPLARWPAKKAPSGSGDRWDDRGDGGAASLSAPAGAPAVAAADAKAALAEVNRLVAALELASAGVQPPTEPLLAGGWGSGAPGVGLPSAASPGAEPERRLARQLERQESLKKAALVRVKAQAAQIDALRSQLLKAGLQPAAGSLWPYPDPRAS
jgi:hypothetical protein